jgi:hypothetical protein
VNRPLPVWLAVVAAACNPRPHTERGRAERGGDPAAVALPDAMPVDATIPTGRWLKGSTHVHARPSGDSREPIPGVIEWYRSRGYDFIALTDHNRVSEVDPDVSTAGEAAIYTDGLIVLSGVELTYNPSACDPPPPPRYATKCRIHANILGATARPPGRIEWADRKSRKRIDSYQRVLDRAAEWGGVVQINHPTWFWGVDGALLTELARRGALLVEVANKQFARWNAGDDDHEGAEAIWDAALSAGLTMWGVASDDAHDYDEERGGTYPAGGAWVMVWADPAPGAILDALAAGRFYGSTGVSLARAGVDGGELVVEVADDSAGDHVIRFVGDGAVLAEHRGRAARHRLDAASYVRAVVERPADGARAWVQPARR